MDNVIDAVDCGVGAPARPPVASFVVVEDVAPERTLTDRLFGAPGWTFHAVCVTGALSFAWATSSPAGLDLIGDPFAWLALACLLSFGVRTLIAASRRSLTSAFLGAPVIAAVLAAGVYVEIPQETRWAQAEGGFESALRALPTASKWDQDIAEEIVPGRIGSYWINGVSRDAAGAAQFHLDGKLNGGLDGTAFTYLVDGPTAEVAEANPGARFEHLHGNWYIVHPAG